MSMNTIVVMERNSEFNSTKSGLIPAILSFNHDPDLVQLVDCNIDPPTDTEGLFPCVLVFWVSNGQLSVGYQMCSRSAVPMWSIICISGNIKVILIKVSQNKESLLSVVDMRLTENLTR
jgi:hypothetical protein